MFTTNYFLLRHCCWERVLFLQEKKLKFRTNQILYHNLRVSTSSILMHGRKTRTVHLKTPPHLRGFCSNKPIFLSERKKDMNKVVSRTKQTFQNLALTGLCCEEQNWCFINQKFHYKWIIFQLRLRWRKKTLFSQVILSLNATINQN